MTKESPMPNGAQYWKACGEKLQAELAAKHKPSHVRAILKVLRGELARAQHGKQSSAYRDDVSRGKLTLEQVAENIFLRLCREHPPDAQNILTMVESLLIRQRMREGAQAVDELFAELAGEFEPGPLRMVLSAAGRAGKRQQRLKAEG